MNLTVVNATMEHALAFLREPIRQVDVDEWVATGGKHVRHLVRETMEAPGCQPRALLNGDGLCICLWGVVPKLNLETGETFGMVWLIASREAERHARSIHRFWRHELGRMHLAAGDHLVCLAAFRNDLHQEWLAVLGFELRYAVNHEFGVYDRWRHSQEDTTTKCVAH